jgi:ATP-dependent DNA ligase
MRIASRCVATYAQKSREAKPVLVGQVEFRQWTPDDHLGHSRFVAMRDDKKRRVTSDGEPA